jgi:3'-phosphoadenosine 5'-phosphosulfate sulfotransferase (PAPS reductase)/FAD synthetase
MDTTSTTRDPSNLSQWDLIVINSSAGKDSQAMLDEVATAAAADPSILSRVVVIHADLGRVEWDGTKALVYSQAAAYGLENRTFDVARPQGDLVQQIRDRAAMLAGKGRLVTQGGDTSAWPDSKNRYCTSDQKRGQCMKVLTLLVDEIRQAAAAGAGETVDPSGRVRVLNCLGFRAQESTARARRVPMSLNKKATNGKREVWDYLPIHTWDEAAVWERIEAAGTTSHPAYALGMPRLSCVFCVFAPKAALVIAAKANPTLFAEYLALEEVAGTFRHGFSLAEVAQAIEAGEAETLTAAEAAAWNM